MIVLVNPITKTPTCFEPGESTPNLIFDGQYQNVADVSDDWVEQERERMGQRVLKLALGL